MGELESDWTQLLKYVNSKLNLIGKYEVYVLELFKYSKSQSESDGVIGIEHIGIKVII